MIRPETNLFRDAVSLDGLWECRAEEATQDGFELGWHQGFDEGLKIAVPGSWNEQLAEAGFMNQLGPVWYQTRVLVPTRAEGKHASLYFGSADYSAVVYVNGQEVGCSGPPKLPFEIDITEQAEPCQTLLLVVKVETLLPEHGPMQRVTREDYVAENRIKTEYYPAVRFDFFPFGGLNRSVVLNILPPKRMRILQVDTAWDSHNGRASLSVSADAPGCADPSLRVSIDGHVIDVQGLTCVETFHDKSAWSSGSPTLYDLTVELMDGSELIDSLSKRVGFRTLSVSGNKLLLNGEAIVLKGFGKHEDTLISGRGVNLPALIKDFQLLKWTGANSVRTSHYPYDETFLDMADEAGILVISEVFSVNLDFRRTDERDLAAHKESIDVLFARDRSHASVVAWSLSNEPGYLGESEYSERSGEYWQALFSYAKSLDAERPMTTANVQYAGIDDPAFECSDFLTVNRYFGWYTEPGQLGRARVRLQELFDTLWKRYQKPLFVAEFGADAVAGMHATTDQMWTEDYQSDLIEMYWQVITGHEAGAGGHVWNFADFRTAQHARRAIMNRKGVFTRERDPKRAAFTIKRLWAE